MTLEQTVRKDVLPICCTKNTIKFNQCWRISLIGPCVSPAHQRYFLKLNFITLKSPATHQGPEQKDQTSRSSSRKATLSASLYGPYTP
ncbi:hypothetical protein EJB05_01462, partial [Eragrostis curvula]